MKTVFLEKLSEKIGNSSVLVVLLLTLFIVPVIPDPELGRTVFSILLTIIFFMGVLAMEKYKKIFFLIAVIALITEWISYIFQFPLLELLSQSTNIIFFLLIVARFIIQIAREKNVDATVIIQSINGYLLLGMAYAILVAVVMQNNVNAYNFSDMIRSEYGSGAYIHEYIYYTFVTFTTLGYGDIVPLIPLSKSLSLLISISCQIYIAIIIAMLVGKYASTPQKE